MSNEPYSSFPIQMDPHYIHLSYPLRQRKIRRRPLIIVRFYLLLLVVKLLPERGH